MGEPTDDLTDFDRRILEAYPSLTPDELRRIKEKAKAHPQLSDEQLDSIANVLADVRLTRGER